MNFLSSADMDRKGIERLFRKADSLSEAPWKGRGRGFTIALFFEEPSTRTRVSFEVAAAQLGGTPIYVDARTSQASRGEELSDTARVLSSYCDMIAVRMNDHGALADMAKASSVPVINALTSLEHPTQALADCYAISRRKGRVKGMRIAFIGDIAQNTANSLMVTAAKLGASVSLVGPKESAPNGTYLRMARRFGAVDVTDSISEGLDGADIVYTDTFVSMGDEKESARRKRLFSRYQLNSRALSYAKGGALVMHPLPAHRGIEITADVIDGPRSIVWDQARSKLAIERALISQLLGRN